jgi:cyclopropane fatty-acyl-phospholipid synthase-like methyltransferase
MGPNALWLIDDLTGHLELQPGQRVLDLGCGTAMTSIFLAREFGVYVHAADLWIRPADNLARIYEAGVESSVVPVEAEAHALPFAQDSFDAIVSVDAYHYFGTDVRYLTYLATFLRSGGTIAVVVPGNETDPDDATDDDAPTWDERFRADWFSFRSATWWARHWRRTFGITVHRAEMLPEGPQLWRRHLEADMAWTGVYPNDPHDGAGLGFVRLIATKS